MDTTKLITLNEAKNLSVKLNGLTARKLLVGIWKGEVRPRALSADDEPLFCALDLKVYAGQKWMDIHQVKTMTGIANARSFF